MQQNEVTTRYEVYCHNCKVTFAAGTRKCLHCGGRLASEGWGGALRRPAPVGPGKAPVGPEEAGMPEIVVVDEAPSGRPRLPISPITLLWIVLIAGTFAQRACEGG